MTIVGILILIGLYYSCKNQSLEEKVIDGTKPRIIPSEKRPVFFLIGSQRSGSNWLRSMMNESKDVAGPHPPHILKRFTPEIMEKFGDLQDEENFKTLIDHVCEFVEKNPVTWESECGKAIIFDRENILRRA